MKKVKSLFLKVIMTILVLGTLPSLTGMHTVQAEGANDPAPEINPAVANGKKVLFDNTHGQTAGAADWVIDGGFSDFGNAIAKKGYYVKELRKSTPITYDDLKDYDVFVIGEANNPYKKSEQNAMIQYVQSGGSIFFISDHYNADRNKNRWDASEAFNGYRRGAYENPAKGMSPEEANSAAMQGVESSNWLSDNFGVRFRYNAVGDLSASNVVSPNETFGITSGVKSVAVHAGSTLAITDPKQAKGLVYLPKLTSKDKWNNAVDQGVYFGGGVDEGAYVAISKLGKGKAGFIGDSSPVEDASPKYLREENGTKKTTYDGFKEEDDAILLTNMIDWLAEKEDYSSFEGKIPLDKVSPMLDMEIPEKSTEPQPEPWAPPAAGYKWYDSSTFAAGSYGSTKPAELDAQYSFVHQSVLPNQQEFQIRVSADHLAPGQTVSGLKVGIYLAGGEQIAKFQNSDGTWPASYDYSSEFSFTADSFGHASKDLTVKINPQKAGAASLRLKVRTKNELTEAVTIGNVPSEPLPEDKPNVPDQISIKDARAVQVGKMVTVEGVVTSKPGAFGGQGFYLQDESAGIYVFQNEAGYQPGDVLKITASTEIFNNELELSNPTIIEKTGTKPLPDAKLVDGLNDENQGQLVQLTNVKIDNLTVVGRAFEFDAIKDGKSSRIRVDERTGVTYDAFSQKYKNGDVINITGISSVFKDVYQLKPLSFDHFVKADTTGPVIGDFDKLTIYQTDSFEQNVVVTDEGSGVAGVKITLDGQVIGNPIKIKPLALALGNHVIVVHAVDHAGNESMREFTLRVIMDVDHLDEFITIGYEKGLITNNGIYNSLLSKVEGIQKANNENAKRGKLNALSNEVQAQKGKKIDSDYAVSLLDLIDYLSK
ncbi:endonuclease [Heyndrickxia sp. NPDC080065]|uniref:endonuclease n=1 Tax=Heyndrickxia sp. NPDC080065 TaxID=3390568 RepID=UPI003D04951B